MKKREDTNSTKSKHSGFYGLYEATLRRSKTAVHAVTLMPLYLLAVGCIGLPLAPGVGIFHFALSVSESFPFWAKYPILGSALAFGYFLFGFSLIFIIPAVNWLMRAYLKPWRGPYYSLEAVRWYIHNGLTYLVRFTFLEFITPTPFNVLFYKMMGMKIGDHTQINTSHISDPSLIELGEKVTIGGSVTLIAHYGVGGYLVISPLKIGNGATIGLRAIVMGGVEIGENARILPNSVILPKTKIPPGETWGGVPATKIEQKTSVIPENKDDSEKIS